MVQGDGRVGGLCRGAWLWEYSCLLAQQAIFGPFIIRPVLILPSGEGMSMLCWKPWRRACRHRIGYTGNTAIVRDGIEVLVVPVDDVDALSAAILTLYSPELRRQMGQSGARGQWRFSLNVVAEQLRLIVVRMKMPRRA